jgi:hypothetical protein
MLYVCVERFDVIGERENILGWNGEVNKAQGTQDLFKLGPGRCRAGASGEEHVCLKNETNPLVCL